MKIITKKEIYTMKELKKTTKELKQNNMTSKILLVFIVLVSLLNGFNVIYNRTGNTMYYTFALCVIAFFLMIATISNHKKLKIIIKRHDEAWEKYIKDNPIFDKVR